MTIMHRKFFLLSPGVWNQERMERMKAVHPSIRVASKKKKKKKTNERTKKRLEEAYALSLFFYLCDD
jgi:hypothetical protein